MLVTPDTGRWLRPHLVVTAVWIAVVALVGLGGDFPLNDDWAYSWSARHLAATGEMRILDWAAPSLVTHIAWGAALVKIAGGSYVVLRVGTLVWALGGLHVLLWFGRRSGLDEMQSLLLALVVGLSPWYVNLSFGYMTDVPWLVMMLAAMTVALTADRLQWWRLAIAGVLVTAAALTRQFAIVFVPGFVALIALDARRLAGDAWLKKAIAGAAAFCVPVVVGFGAFQYWYKFIHHPTLANSMTWGRMLVPPYMPPFHAAVIWHYFGFWVLAVVAGLAAQRKLAGEVSRKWAVISAVILAGFALGVWIIATLDDGPGRTRAAFPFIGNITYLLGAGPTTIRDVYLGYAPYPHEVRWVGPVLDVFTTIGGVFAGVWIVRAVKSAKTIVRSADGSPRARARVLVLATSAVYLAFHLATGPFLFDRYLFVVMPATVWLALDSAPASAARSWAAYAVVGVVALFSVGATHEYLSWSGARDEAVRALEARGVSDDDIDGGFEVNGPRHFIEYAKRTGKLENMTPGKAAEWWVPDARYRIAFWPSADGTCKTVATYPFWSWPLSGERAMYTLQCR